MAHDTDSMAVQDDLFRRSFERWMREQRGPAQAPTPKPIRSDDFWGDIEGLFADLDQTLAIVSTLAAQLQRDAPHLRAHLEAARESLLPLYREAQAHLEARPLTRTCDVPMNADPNRQAHLLIAKVVLAREQTRDDARRRDRALALQSNPLLGQQGPANNA